jgi:hypothetical protein
MGWVVKSVLRTLYFQEKAPPSIVEMVGLTPEPSGKMWRRESI